jgi:nucleoside-diphosphate-sugar epimerase
MHVAIMGGAGYIGSVVVEVLGEEGHDVVVVTTFPKGIATP